MDQIMEQIKGFWLGMSSRQRMFSAAGAVLTVALIAVFARLIVTPDYKPLLSGVEPADTSAITAQLAAKNIPFLVSPDGKSISVPGDMVDAARLEIASHDTPHSGRMGFEIFDKVSWGQTEFDEKVNYQRALEGELERTIQTMSNVRSARVHVVMASDSVFLDRERSAKASVMLRLKSGSLSREDFSSISRLVAGAVDNLKAGDVAVIDADSNRAFGSDSAPGFGDSVEQELTRRLVATLAPVLGADHIRASVSLELEAGTKEESQEKYDPAVSVSLNRQVSDEQVGPGSTSGGVPGTASNVPTGTRPTATTGSVRDNGQSSKTESETYGVNKTLLRTVEPAGRVRRMTAAVLVDDRIDRHQEKGKWVEVRHKRSPDELKQISDLAQAAIGLDSARGDLINVQDMSFQEPDEVELAKVTALDKVKKGLADYSAIVRYAALLVLFVLAYLLMLRPVQKRALAAGSADGPRPKLKGAGTRAIEASAAVVNHDPIITQPTGSAQRAMTLKKQLADFVKVEPENSTSAVRAWLREETL